MKRRPDPDSIYPFAIGPSPVNARILARQFVICHLSSVMAA